MILWPKLSIDEAVPEMFDQNPGNDPTPINAGLGFQAEQLIEDRPWDRGPDPFAIAMFSSAAWTPATGSHRGNVHLGLKPGKLLPLPLPLRPAF